MSSEQAPRLVLSAGEPAGIGPDLCLEWSRSPRQADVVVAADIDLLFERAKQLRIPIEVDAWEPGQPITRDPGRLSVWSVSQCPNKQAGRLDPANAGYVLDTLGAATDACIDGTFDALVTGPVHKGNIADAGHDFSGHTEFLQERCGVDRVVMMLATEGLRVALVTTHLPLKDVPGAITRDRLSEVTRILHGDLHKHFGLDAPRILVAGLNPHAGEGGHMGREEIDVIEPTLETLRSEGMDLVGPLPADTLFTPHWLEQADAVLAMYHDQGLPVLKYKGFGNAVNITLGLPIIRTSVDHGTAIDLAGTGRADGGSLRTALVTAEQMALHRRQEGTA